MHPLLVLQYLFQYMLTLKDQKHGTGSGRESHLPGDGPPILSCCQGQRLQTLTSQGQTVPKIRRHPEAAREVEGFTDKHLGKAPEPAQGAAPTQAKTFKEARDTLKIQDPRLAQLEQLKQQQRLLSQQHQQLQNQLYPRNDSPEGSVTGEGKKKKKNKGKKGKTSLLTTAQPNTSPLTQ